MTSSLAFFARFVVISSAAFWVWNQVSHQYMATIVPVVNGAFALTDLPVDLALRGGALVFTYALHDGSSLRLQALGHESVYLNLIAVLSLFAATQGMERGSMARWLLGVGALLWVTHVASFYAAGQIAVWEYANSLGPAERVALGTELSLCFPQARIESLQRGLELWNVWSRYAIGAGLWFLFVATSKPAVALERAGHVVRRRRLVGLSPASAATR